MWSFEGGAPGPLPDAGRFLRKLDAHADFFDHRAPVCVARAPGRLDLMGGIADYSGSLVLELPLEAATYVAAQLTSEPTVTVLSTAGSDPDVEPLVAIPLENLESSEPDYGDVRSRLGESPARRWAAYVVGALPVLRRELGARLDRGLRALVYSEVPPGSGVSSSAALEVAAVRAISEACGIRVGGRDAALLCQRVENLVVGAPCGVMDQMTAALGERSRLLALLCQPAELEPVVPLPEEIEVWGVHSGISHAVSGVDYGTVRTAAFMGYRIVAELSGLEVAPSGEGRVRIADPVWHGYLANVPPSVWEERFRARVPEVAGGAAFLETYGGVTDAVTRVYPSATYPVRQATAHPIYEHHRVRLFRALLSARPLDEEHLWLLGELMYQSHASYGACGLGSEGTDRLVEMVREAGMDSGLYGAKITGGGSGGTVAVLARRGSEPLVREIAERYERLTGRAALVLGGSSPGAFRIGVGRLVPAQARAGSRQDRTVREEG